MKLQIGLNDAIIVLIEMTAESIATDRLLIDAVLELTYPDEAARRLAQMMYRQRVEEARIAILHKIYEHRGKVDLDELGLDDPQNS